MLLRLDMDFNMCKTATSFSAREFLYQLDKEIMNRT